MNSLLRLRWQCMTVVLLLAGFSHARSQDVADPLTIQGLDQSGYMSARARAMGGTGTASGNDVSAMFANPATLTGLMRPEVRVAGYFSAAQYEQKQQWVPNRFYGGLSLMFEDLLDGIKDVEPVPPNRADRVQRPYDDLGPNWTKKTNNTRPSLGSVGVPFVIDEIRCAAALGFSEMVNLNTFYQNNNALLPNIGLYRPSPTPIVVVGDSLAVDWFQFIRQRGGTISGVTPALSVELLPGVSFGASATILFGSSDDFEQRVDRGRLTFFYDKFRSDSVYHHVTRTGTSQYNGMLPTIGGLLRQGTFSIGVSIRLPMTITRDWDRTVQEDTTGARRTYAETGTDKLRMPLSVTLGGVLHPSPRWDITFDYDIRDYASVRYTPSSGAESNPWLGSHGVHAGAEYRALNWLAVRGGFRQVVGSFAAAGAAIIDEPVSGSAFSGGAGFRFDQFVIDIAYEYTHLGYEDAWQSNVNFNKRNTHTVWLETGMQF